jgi:glycosyltransferase involved in cell wall biosynthesis
MNAPKISVITPVLNGERFLFSAIESILNQTFGDFEVLIIDDGSTDGTPEVIEQLKKSDPRIRSYRTEGLGVAPASNLGIRKAKGEFIAKVDADDLTLPDRFEKQIRFFSNNPDCVVVGGQCELIDDVGRPLGPMPLPTDHDAIDALLLGGRGSAILQPCAMFRTDAIRQVGMYDESLYLAEDHDLFLKLGEVGKLANLPDVLVYFRKHPTSITGLEPLRVAAPRTAKVLANAFKRRGMSKSEVKIRNYYRPETIQSLYLRWGLRALRHGHVKSSALYLSRCVAESTLHPLTALKEVKRYLFDREDFFFSSDGSCKHQGSG